MNNCNITSEQYIPLWRGWVTFTQLFVSLLDSMLIQNDDEIFFIPHLSLSCPPLYHHRRNTKLSNPTLSLHAIIMSWHLVQHTPSTAYTEYSIHRVQHTPSTAYTQSSIHPVQHTPSTAYTEYSIHRVQHTQSTAYTKYSIHRVQDSPKIVCHPFIFTI